MAEISLQDLYVLENTISEATEHQRLKVLRFARQILPNLTFDDILNPQDFPELVRSPDFQFEDGNTAGMFAALMIVRRFIKERSEESK
jgi:hypothetical protein